MCFGLFTDVLVVAIIGYVLLVFFNCLDGTTEMHLLVTILSTRTTNLSKFSLHYYYLVILDT